MATDARVTTRVQPGATTQADTRATEAPKVVEAPRPEVQGAAEVPAASRPQQVLTNDQVAASARQMTTPTYASSSTAPTTTPSRPQEAVTNSQPRMASQQTQAMQTISGLAPEVFGSPRPSSMPSMPAAPSTPTTVAEAEQLRHEMEDRPISNQSARELSIPSSTGDVFSQDEIGAARDDRLMLGRDPERAARAERQKVVNAQAKSLKAYMARSVSRGNNARIKPSIFDRFPGHTRRKTAQLATDNMPTHRPSERIRPLRKRIAKQIGKSSFGNKIYGKIVGLHTLSFREVGVGIQEIIAVIDQNPDMLDNLIRASIPASKLVDFTTVRSMLYSEVADLVNENEVDVFTAKPPNNRGQDVQRRKLRILEGEQRGIYLHPVMAAMYTADFDGDDMLISLDPSLAGNAKDPMEHMVGVDGAQSLDMAFLPVSKIVDGYEDGKTARDYVREVMLSRWSRRINDTYNFARSEFNSLVDAVMKLSDSADQSEDDQAAAYGDLFRAARAFADKVTMRVDNETMSAVGNPTASNRIMSSVTESVYQGMRNLRVNNALLTMGEVVPRDTLPPALTSDDDKLYEVIDGMVMGAVPNNFQELKVMMGGFLGNVSGKSAPFRFTADVGKMMKLDSRFRIGDEYVVDPDSDADMMDFLHATVKFAYSKRMAVDVKSQGKSLYFMEELRSNVIHRVGFIDDVNEDGTPRYATVFDFIMTFANEYNRQAAIINEANLVWLANMAISSKSNRKTVIPIKNVHNGRLTYSDVASPFIETYGNYSFSRMFGNLVDYEKYDPYGPKGKKTRQTEYEWYRSRGGKRWIKARYSAMSIKAFSTQNQIHLSDDERKLSKSVVGGYDADILDGLIAAIADKRTSTASKYNTDVVGMYQSGDNGKVRGHVKETSSGDKKTLVGMMMDPLMDIRDADMEGTMLLPGYYAGIGSRETPPEVGRAMTDLAKRLADMGYALRSGHAKGADQAFETGAGSNADIYLPSGERDMRPRAGGRMHSYASMSQADREAAERSVDRYHPNPKALNKSARGKMSRNYFQVFGSDGQPESAFIACWTPVEAVYDEKTGKRKYGGTNQALRMAQERGIPIFNAAEYKDLEQWKSDVIDAALKAQAGQLYRATTTDQMLHVDDAVMALNASSYDMFHDLNMDSTAGFLNSAYGAKMVQYADNADVLAGIRAAMVFEWQIQEVTRLADRLRDADISDTFPVAERENLQNQIALAMDELASKSMVWRAIMSEIRSKPDQTAFSRLKVDRAGMGWCATDFWTNVRLRQKSDGSGEFRSLRDVIEDLDMPWPLKCDIITDVVRWQTQDYNFNPYEVAFQLEVGGDSRFSLNGGAPKAALQVYRDMDSASTRYANRSLRNLRNEVNEAATVWRNQPNVLTNAIHRLAKCPWDLVYVDDRMYADSLLAVRDKTYAQTEKAKKHPWTNAIYSAISFQRNGGFFNDVYRYDDRLLGLQHASSVSAADIVKLLDDPDYMITVYDDYGSIGFLTQQTLLGINHRASEQEIWDYLIRNPRIASVLRAGAACVIADEKANGYVGARLSLSETIGNYGDGNYDVMGHVKYLMREHPVYAGLISILTPAHGTSVRNERNRVPQIEEAVCRELYRAASEGTEMGASRVLTNLGITRLKLRSLLTSDYDKFMDRMGFGWNAESIGEAKTEANDIYDTLERHVQGYIEEIRREAPLGIVIPGSDSLPEFMGIDIESIASFWDAVQELSGAKVGVSTGIEGSETFKLSYWVSHMGAKDNYANLSAIENLILDSQNPEEFDGMWTSAGTLSVQVAEDGHVTTNISELRQSSDNGEIITRVPESFIVPDRSTDSFGNQVPSLYVSMVSKRSNGAEKFNLKAMKAGLDGTDSVTKMKGGKYITEVSDGKTYPILYFQVRQELSDIAAQQGIDAARMELARRIQKQDQQMGYDDMSLANYMCLAEIMLIEGEDGDIVLRSLEQLVSGIRGRIGSRVDDMTDGEVLREIQAIMSDVSEQGIGRSQVWDANELLSELRPKGNAGDASTGVKLSSSVFQRNYDLLREIQRKTGIVPLDYGERSEIHDQIVGKDGIKEIGDVWRRCQITREYQVIGYIGALDGSQNLNYRNIGPSTAIVIGPNQNVTSEQILSVCRRAYVNGTTVIVSKENVIKVPPSLAKDMIPASSSGDMLIPMFDMRLNGSEAKPFEPNFAIFQVPRSRYVVSVEDVYNVFELGDAQYKFTSALTSRLKARSGGTQKLSAMNLFPNVFKNINYRDAEFSVQLADRRTVEDLICTPDSPQCTIDYGLVEGAKGFGQRVHDVNAAIRRYKQQISNVSGETSALIGMDNVQPGDIVGWADIKISRNGFMDEHVLAPIIPFPLSGGTRSPESFTVKQVGSIDRDGSQFEVDWGVLRDLTDGFIKYFDSSGGANKGMINLSDVIEDTMRLRNGIDVDAYCAAASTDSRKIGTDRRIKTMISLMAMARMEGYNIAEVEGSFPNDPDIKQQLLSGRLPREFWASRYDGQGPIENPVVFCTDDHINAFLNFECKKIYDNGGNPSDYLASRFTDEDGNTQDTNVMWEFECMFETGLQYEDSLLRFLHFVNNDLCPNGLDDDTEDKHFRLYREGDDLASGYNRGMLQMQVPFPMSDGRTSYVWSNVFVGMSFFGEEWSGNSRPNVSGASDMLDAENTMSYYGVKLNKRKSEVRSAYATAGYGRYPAMDMGAFGLE